MFVIVIKNTTDYFFLDISYVIIPTQNHLNRLVISN